MSPIMQPGDWNTDETRTSNQYILTAKEREFILTGDPSSYTEARMNRHINKKAGRVANRIQDLLDDLCLLYLGGFLGEPREEPDVDVDSLVFRTPSVRDKDVCRSEYEAAQPTSNLGFEIGSLLRMLNLDEDPSSIVWNFLLGLVGRPVEEIEQEREHIQAIIDELETRHERRLFQAGADLVLEEGDEIQQLYRVTRDVLYDENITPAEPLVTAIVQHQVDPDSFTLNIGEPSSSMSENDQLPVSNTPPEKPPDAMTTGEWNEASIRRTVRALLAETNLREVENLCDDLKADIHQINTRKQFGTQAKEVFHCFSLDTRIERSDFPTESYSSTEMLSAVLHKLSPQEKHPLWTTRPVIKEPAEAEWKLTPYGQLLYKAVFDYEETTSWVYQGVVETDSLTEREVDIIEKVIDV